MSKIGICIIIGVMIGLCCSLIGLPLHNYELNKCNYLSNTNQEYYNYELQKGCYFVLEKTGWNLFGNCLIFGIIGGLFFGFIGFIIGDTLPTKWEY